MLKRFISDIKKYSRYSLESAKSQLKSEVANSYLNWVWWILEPICFMLIYTFIFGYVFKAREPSFSVYIYIGITMWSFFEKTLKSSTKLVKSNRAVVAKVYFPKYILLLTKILVNGFKMMISFGVVIVLMVVNRIPFTFHMLWFFPILLTLVLFTFGLSCFTLHGGVYVSDLSNVLNIVLRMFFYLTGIFYNLETRIPTYGALINRCIPTAYLLSAMRQSLIYGTSPYLPVLLLWLAVSVLLCVLGVRKIYKEENSYVKAI